jgi:hypothetical protein
MNSGRELDLLVAEKVMGYAVRRPYDHNPLFITVYPKDTNWQDSEVKELPQYSTDISAAWEVVERMKEKFHFKIDWDKNLKSWLVTISDGYSFWKAHEEAAPPAICLAALKAKGVEV